MNLHDLVRETFAQEGPLARSTQVFIPRDGQTEMALAIARTIEEGGVLVVEAGTGIGKTYAYLVPALLSATRVLLSTATKTLQDQLFGRDLPQLIKALGLPVKVALLKGRGSYLCLHRLAMARHSLDFSQETPQLSLLARLEAWGQLTRSGDLAEMAGLDERSVLIPLVTSTRDNCLGSDCTEFRRCHVNQARREALAADVVVINHHLFFADLAVRESGVAELLPTVRTVIFDEAHQLNETGVQLLGRQLSSAQLLDFSRDLLATGQRQARGLCDWQTLAVHIEQGARELRLVFGPISAMARLPWNGAVPDQLNAAAWQDALDTLERAYSQVVQALALVSEVSPDLHRLRERADKMARILHAFREPRAPGSVRWIEVGGQIRLVETPLDIAEVVRTRLIQPSQASETSRSWIFTSATLGDDARLQWFTEPCGLGEAQILRIGSPFNYPDQAALYVPGHFPKPGDPGHSTRVAELVARAAIPLNGRTLVLTTTLRALTAVSEALRHCLPASADIEVLTQGQQTKRELIERFRQGGEDGRPGCVLVASVSFWEGVDVPGDALQLVVIDKLPFPPPNDPLVEARTSRLEALGRSVFNNYFLPEAAIALKQGAGRLIRRESDRGILVICDSRLTHMGYGRRLIAALPPMRRIRSEDELNEALLALTRTSTRNPSQT